MTVQSRESSCFRLEAGMPEGRGHTKDYQEHFAFGPYSAVGVDQALEGLVSFDLHHGLNRNPI